MRRTWGYIVMAVCTLMGVAALLMPLPETVVVSAEKGTVKKAQPERPAPQTRPKKGGAKTVAKAPPAPVKKFPMQDTTKGRVTPKR